jgi:osmotically-inducible protein OsmY
MKNIDKAQTLEGGMYVEMWFSHADEVQAQVELQGMIWDELRCEPAADVEGVNVEVEDFVARLTGSVPSYAAKLRVQAAAERVPKIIEVINEVAVAG